MDELRQNESSERDVMTPQYYFDQIKNIQLLQRIFGKFTKTALSWQTNIKLPGRLGD